MSIKEIDLRNRINTTEPLIVPGCYDTLSALLIEKSGFEAVLVSGFGVSASLLGMPDVELYNESDMVDVVRRVCARVSIPVFADADNGYGNAINVMKTVADLEQAGAAAITLEDQRSPKQCPLLNSRPSLVSIAEAVGKIKAAIAARRNANTLIIARTDAVDADDVIARASAYAAAGADAIKLISPAVGSTDFIGTVRQHAGVPIMLASLGWLAAVDTKELQGSVGIITHPLLALRSSAKAIMQNMQALSLGVGTSSLARFPADVMSVEEIENVLDLATIRANEELYLPVI